MAILKVEPLTTARRCGARSTTGGRRRWRGSRSAAWCGCRSGRGACSASSSSSPTPRSWRRSGSPSRSRRLRRVPRRSWSSSASGWRASTARLPRAGLSLVLPPGTGTGRAARTVRAKTELRAEILPAGEAALGGRRAARGEAAGGAGGARRGRRDVGAAAGRRGRGGARDPAPARRAWPDRDPRLERPPRPRRLRSHRRRTSAAAPARAGGRGRGPGRGARRRGGCGPRAAPPRRHRLGQDRGLPGGGRGGARPRPEARSSSSPRSASPRRPSPASAARLGDRVAVLHSALSDGERFDEWQRLRSGEASVCVGPRSAIFAPVRDLGLIVIDEEHDASYKQDGDPTYDARAVARHRAAERGAVLVAGTATPRPETWLELAAPGAAAPGRRAAHAAGQHRRHARGRPALGPAPRRHLDGAGGGPRGGSQGDRDGQPPRLRTLAHLPLLRPPLGLSQL